MEMLNAEQSFALGAIIAYYKDMLVNDVLFKNPIQFFVNGYWEIPGSFYTEYLKKQNLDEETINAFGYWEKYYLDSLGYKCVAEGNGIHLYRKTKE